MGEQRGQRTFRSALAGVRPSVRTCSWRSCSGQYSCNGQYLTGWVNATTGDGVFLLSVLRTTPAPLFLVFEMRQRAVSSTRWALGIPTLPVGHGGRSRLSFFVRRTLFLKFWDLDWEAGGFLGDARREKDG